MYLYVNYWIENLAGRSIIQAKRWVYVPCLHGHISCTSTHYLLPRRNATQLCCEFANDARPLLDAIKDFLVVIKYLLLNIRLSLTGKDKRSLDERRDVLGVSDTHWVVGYALLVDVYMFGVVSAWTWFDCLVSGDETPSEQRVHWSLVLVLVLVDDLVPIAKFSYLHFDIKNYLAAPGVRARSWSKEPICRREVIL